MTIIWGGNFTLVKVAVRTIPELSFNALRLTIAAVAFLAVLVAREGTPRFTKTEWWQILQLAVIGHVVYQLCFLGAVARTSVANTALIFAFTPVTVGLLSAWLGHERVGVQQWTGAVLSLAGIALVVGGGASEGATTVGNVIALAAMLCWTLYTVASRPLLNVHSALSVTGYSLALGAFLYFPLAWGSLTRTPWPEVPAFAWMAMAASGVLALFVAYLIWYTAVFQLGPTHTAIYSNVTPIVAMVVAYLWLGEPLTLRKLAGALAVIFGVAITRVERRPLPGEG